MTDWLQQVEAMGCGALETNLDGVVMQANGLLKDSLDRDPIGKPLDDVWDPGTAAFWSTSIAPLIALKGRAFDIAVAIGTPSGRAWHLAFCSTADTKLRILLVPFHERQKYELAMNEARKRDLESRAELRHLQDLDAFRSDFLNSLSHELNTPFTPALLQLSKLKRLSTTPEQQEALEIMERNLNRLHEFNTSMIAATKLHLREWMAPRSIIDLRAAAQAAIADVQPTMPQSIVLDGDAGAGCAHDGSIQDCIRRLLDNCGKFCPADATVQVRVSAGKIVIADNGPGIRSDKLRQLGRPFFKAHADTDNARLGAGLGLFIVRGMMEAMGGTMTLRPDASGTEVTLQVPTKCDPA